jgi:PAS domain S-box-containing protein
MPMSEAAPRSLLVAPASHLLDRVDAAVVIVDLDGVVLYANQQCALLYGRRLEEMVGANAITFAAAPVNTELRHEIGAALRRGESWEGDFDVERGDGTVVSVHAIQSSVVDDAGELTAVLSVAVDASGQRRSREQLQRMFAVVEILRDIGETLTSGLSTERVMHTVTRAARRLSNASIAAFLERVDHDPGQFVVRVVSGRRRGSTIGTTVSSADAFIAEVLTSKTPLRFDSVVEGSDAARTLAGVMRAEVGPLRSCIVAPVRARDEEAIGVMIVAHHEPDHFSHASEQTLVDVAGQAGVAIEIARLFRAVQNEVTARRESEAVQRFFAETSALLSWSLDYPETYQRLTQLCVPFLADLCLIDVADGDRIRRVAAAHADRSKTSLVQKLLVEYAPDPFSVHPAADVVRGGRSQFAEDMTDEFLHATTKNEEHFAIVKELGFTSYMCVPLTARGRTIGALSLVSAGSGRRFGTRELELAEELARRAALAIDNARLFTERDHVARALQSSLLPPSLPAIPGMTIAARYIAAGEGNEVGGDFYDVFQSGRNAWWFVVGDVSGKGPKAASIAGLARHTLHAVAMERRSPRHLLAALHETLARGEGQGEFCTVCCALMQRVSGAPGTWRLSIACGGHPAPLVRRRDDTIQVAGLNGPLLGLPLRSFKVRQETLIVEPGDTIVMYTDGVVEAHHPGQELFGERRLADTIAQAGETVDEVADAIVTSVHAYSASEPRDDLAVLVARIDPASGEPS